MEIIIKGSPKEIAALTLELQGRLENAIRMEVIAEEKMNIIVQQEKRYKEILQKRRAHALASATGHSSSTE